MCNRQKMPGVGLRDGCPLGVGQVVRGEAELVAPGGVEIALHLDHRGRVVGEHLERVQGVRLCAAQAQGAGEVL